MHIQGGPPAPERYCTNQLCVARLVGATIHCMDRRQRLYCDAVCRAEYLKGEQDGTLPHSL